MLGLARSNAVLVVGKITSIPWRMYLLFRYQANGEAGGDFRR